MKYQVHIVFEIEADEQFFHHQELSFCSHLKEDFQKSRGAVATAIERSLRADYYDKRSSAACPQCGSHEQKHLKIIPGTIQVGLSDLILDMSEALDSHEYEWA
jgi:hypothetical protein